MGTFDLANANVADISNQIKDFKVDSESTDGPSTSGKTRIIIKEWNENLGF